MALQLASVFSRQLLEMAQIVLGIIFWYSAKLVPEVLRLDYFWKLGIKIKSQI